MALQVHLPQHRGVQQWHLEDMGLFAIDDSGLDSRHLLLLVQVWPAGHVALLVEGHGGGDGEEDVHKWLGGRATVYLVTQGLNIRG